MVQLICLMNIKLLFTLSTYHVLNYSFLAKRGVKEDIQTFDARKISSDVRVGVEKLLTKNAASFEPKVALYTHNSFSCPGFVASLMFLSNANRNFYFLKYLIIKIFSI